MVSECTVKRLGDLPFDFENGTCGTFIVDSSPIVLLCFAYTEERRCRWLTRRNDEFEFDKIEIQDSSHNHGVTTMANYQGFPLILGGWDNNKLEMLTTVGNPPRWIEYEGTDYPYSNM